MADSDTPEPITVTVTFLEMQAPPPRYPQLPRGPQIALLQARTMPVHYYRYLLDRVGRKWHWVKALRLDDEALRERIHAPGRDIRVFHLDGAPAGFFDLKVGDDGVELAFFGMMEHAIGRGFGRWFLGAAIQTAWSYRPKKVHLQTCTLDHPSALTLYQKMGFVPVGQANEDLTPLSLRERADILVR